MLWEHEKLFEPRNYWEHVLNWRIKDTIEPELENFDI
jgi:hypothetical protein